MFEPGIVVFTGAAAAENEPTMGSRVSMATVPMLVMAKARIPRRFPGLTDLMRGPLSTLTSHSV